MAGEWVLDCGRGPLAIAAKLAQSQATLHGPDGDGEILDIARPTGAER